MISTHTHTQIVTMSLFVTNSRQTVERIDHRSQYQMKQKQKTNRNGKTYTRGKKETLFFLLYMCLLDFETIKKKRRIGNENITDTQLSVL
jgi:hypothetical protein